MTVNSKVLGICGSSEFYFGDHNLKNQWLNLFREKHSLKGYIERDVMMKIRQ